MSFTNLPQVDDVKDHESNSSRTLVAVGYEHGELLEIGFHSRLELVKKKRNEPYESSQIHNTSTTIHNNHVKAVHTPYNKTESNKRLL